MGINFVLGIAYLSLHIGFSRVYELFHEREVVRGFVTLEAFWVIDFCLNFLRVPPKMKVPTIRKTAARYLKGQFVFDLVATIISNIVLMFSSHDDDAA